MARTKQEVRSFLASLEGDRVNAKAGIYNGQCVSLIKALLEFLGVPNPYAARGHAKDYANTLVSQNIAEKGKGWLIVAVNPNMGVINGVRYGHIWLDLSGETNYEQNGAKALTTTRNTRPLNQATQIVNLDKWLKPDVPRKSNEVIAKEVLAGAWGNGVDREKRLKAAGYDYKAIQAIVNRGPAKAPSKPNNNTVAEQVIAGAWGTGDDRKKRLINAGYNYATIQALVNKKLGHGVVGRKTDEQVANEVIAMKWGAGDERKKRLEAAGYNYANIQKIVNRKLGF